MLREEAPILEYGTPVCFTEFTLGPGKFIRLQWESSECQNVLLLQFIPQVLISLG